MNINNRLIHQFPFLNFYLTNKENNKKFKLLLIKLY